MNAINPYLKTAVAVLSTILTALAVYYGNSAWYPIVTSVVGALSVYLVPNIPATPAITKIDVNSAYGQTVVSKDTANNPFGSE